MKTIKYYCDHCGKEYDENSIGNKLKIVGITYVGCGTQEYHFCKKCYNEFDNFINWIRNVGEVKKVKIKEESE